MQTISPARTVNETSFTALRFCTWEWTQRWSTFKTSPAGLASSFVTSSCTGRPTIMLESSCLVVSLVLTVPMYLPLRRTLTRSETSMISLSLWEMNRMDLPSRANSFIVAISSSISCG